MIILATCGNGYAGCDAEEVFFYDEGTAEAIINEDVWQWACENAESYAYVHFGWEEEYTDEKCNGTHNVDMSFGRQLFFDERHHNVLTESHG